MGRRAGFTEGREGLGLCDYLGLGVFWRGFFRPGVIRILDLG